MKIFIKGLNSCGMRKNDLERYLKFLTANGHEIVDHPSKSDVVLLWTCAFRADMRDNSIEQIRRYTEEFGSELVVAGCLPDIDRELLTKEFKGRVIGWRNDERGMEEFFGTKGKRLRDIERTLVADKLCDDVERFRKNNPDKDASFVDQFIKLFVAEGCRYKCSYCSERLAFPPYQSFPEDRIVEACKRMVDETGYKQVMLLGDSLGDYGHDIGTTLPNLIRRLKREISDLRVALQGFNPADFIKYYDEMIEFLRLGWIRHMQIPVQSASDRILKLMNRPYTRADIDRVYGFLNEIGFTEFDSHLIVGFPGENDEDHEESVRFILRHRPKYVLVSAYMEPPMAPSSRLPGKVDKDTTRCRLRDAETQIKGAGILCNTDDSELSAHRRRTLNRIAPGS